MVSSAVKEGKLYNLIDDEMAEYFLNKTYYEVYFLASSKPMVRVTKSNFNHFQELYSKETKYWNNQFVVAFDIPPLKIEIKEYDSVSFKISSIYNSFEALGGLVSEEEWFSKEVDKRYIEATKPLHEARKRGEDPVWDVDLDKIRAEIKQELDEFCGNGMD